MRLIRWQSYYIRVVVSVSFQGVTLKVHSFLYRNLYRMQKNKDAIIRFIANCIFCCSPEGNRTPI